MDIGHKNDVTQSFGHYEKGNIGGIESINDFHKSFNNSDFDVEHRKLMVVEDENFPKLEKKTNHQSNVTEPNETFPITNSFLQPQNNTEHQNQFQDSNPNPDAYTVLQENSTLYLTNQDRRKPGRPRKLFFVEQDVVREKRPRGRPRKTETEEKEKKPVGRPRIYFKVEPMEKRPRGRPRVNLDAKKPRTNESGEKRLRGRPRKYLIKVIKEKRPRGRPRSNLRPDVKKSMGKRGRPSKRTADNSDWHPVAGHVPRAIKQELSSAESESDEDKDNEENDELDDDTGDSAIADRDTKSGDSNMSNHQLAQERDRPRKVLNLIKFSKLDDTSSVEEGNTLSSSVSKVDTVEGM